MALPPAPTAPVPNMFDPSKKVTIPVMVPAAVELTVAVNMTDCPATAGFADGITVVMVGAVVVEPTTWLRIVEVLLLKFVLPLYFAVIECDPAPSVVVVNAPAPFATPPVPSKFGPS